MRQDKSYDSEQNRFIKWFERQHELGLVHPNAQGKIMTRANVDLYFQMDLVSRLICKGSVDRVVNSLQRLANRKELVGEYFRVKDSPIVEGAIEQQKENYQAYNEEAQATTDPLATTKTNILTPDDRLAGMGVFGACFHRIGADDGPF